MSRLKKSGRKVLITLAGFVVLIAGLILIPLPGPGILVTILGLFILSLEYEWAKRHMDRVKSAQQKIVDKAKNRKKQKNT